MSDQAPPAPGAPDPASGTHSDDNAAQSPVLDDAYKLMGEIESQLQANQHAQREQLRKLADDEKQLQAELADAERSGDHQKAAKLHDDLRELTQAWRVATQDAAEPDDDEQQQPSRP